MKRFGTRDKANYRVCYFFLISFEHKNPDSSKKNMADSTFFFLL